MWPGQFVAGRIILRIEKDALVLPEGAVQPGQDRPFVYVVRGDKAVIQEVQVARQIGDRMIIGKGLTGDEQVVVDVPLALTDGATIRLRGAGDGKGERDAVTGKKDGKAKQAPAKEATGKGGAS